MNRILKCMLLLLCLFLCFSCNTKNRKDIEDTDRELGKPESIELHGRAVDLKTWTVTVPNDINVVRHGNVKAKFKLDKEYILKPFIKGDSVTLVEGEENEVELIIHASKGKYKQWNQKIKVLREVGHARDVSIFIKRIEDTTDIKIEDGSSLETSGDRAIVTVTSLDSIMKKVIISNDEVTIEPNGKTAKKEIEAQGKIEVKVLCEKRLPLQFSFNLTKNSKPQVKPIGVNIFTGENYSNKQKIVFDKNNVASISPDDIKYSLVKLEMTMDCKIKTASLIACKDERSENYLRNPTTKDLKGVFSGHLVKEIDLEGEKKLINVKDNIYTEYLIVGFGNVEYEIKFTAEGRKETTYTLKIMNQNTKKEKIIVKDEYSKLEYNNVESWIFLMNSKNPIKNTDLAMLEYMGDNVKVQFKTPSSSYKDDMYFYYNVFQDKTAKVHEFVRIKSEKEKDGTPLLYAFFDPQESYVDAFVALKDSLPFPLNPLSLQNKWKKIINKGFLFGINAADPTRLNMFTQIFNYRIQAKTYEANEELRISYNQKYQDFFDGSLKRAPMLLTGITGQNKDMFIMIPTFDNMKDIVNTIKYSIKIKNTNGWEDVQEYGNVSLSPSKWQNYIILGCKDTNMSNDGKPLNVFNGYTFLKGNQGKENIYKIDVEIGFKDNKLAKFTYIIDYKNEGDLNSK